MSRSALVMTIAVLVSACGQAAGSTGAPTTTRLVVNLPPAQPAVVFEGFFPATDWDQYERLALQVSNGHQPWTVDPVQVVATYLADIGVRTEATSFAAFNESIGEVTWQGGRAVVQRYGPDPSPWVVTAVEATGLSVSIGDYFGEALYVSVAPERDGHLEVRVGAFASEWAGEQSGDVSAGTAPEMTFRLGSLDLPGPEAVLVDIRFVTGDGESMVAQYRVNRQTWVEEKS